jgi:multiple sugar transport system permease protein
VVPGLRLDGEFLRRVAITAVLMLVSITMLFPLLWMISASMKFEADVFNFPIEWIPEQGRMLENFREVWNADRYNFGQFYLNSIKVSVLTTVLTLFVASTAAYAFAKLEFKQRDWLFLGYIATMMIPVQIMLVPRFMITRWVGLYDTHLGLILMGSFVPYAVFLFRQNMLMIPPSITESAKIDGASHIWIYSRIVIPMIQPVIAIQAILKFTWTWNSYQAPLIFLQTRSLYTIQLGLKQFADDSGTLISLVMAGSVSAIIPLIVIFLIGQRFVIDGIAVGGVKG